MFSLFLLRIKETVGESNHIQEITEPALTNFINKNSRIVVFFTDKTQKFDFANFAITKYSDKMRFITSTIDDGKKFGAKGPLSIIAFENGKIVKAKEAPRRSIAFTLWCDSLFAKDSIKIKHPEELRVIFTSTITCCLGVDKEERPAKLRDSITFYSVPHQFFQYFNMNVSNGYYIYRSADRQLVKITSDPNKYINTKVTDLHSSYLEKKQFFGGYFVDETNNTKCQMEAELLSYLANKYDDKMYLGILQGTLAYTLANKHALSYIPLPFFVMFDENGHWIMRGDDIHDKTKIVKFIDSVVNKEQNYTILDEEGEPMNEYIKPVSFNNMLKTVEEDKTDAVLYVTAACGSRCRLFDFLIKKEAEMMKNTSLTFYSINISKNDFPLDLPLGVDVPTMIMWPSKKRVLGPVFFDGVANIDDINRFLVLESSGTFNKPEYNATTIMREAKLEAYPFLRKNKSNNENSTTTTIHLNNTSTKQEKEQKPETNSEL